MTTDRRADLARVLVRARATWRLVDALRVLAAWGAPCLGALLGLLILDNLVHLPGWARLAGAVAWLLGALATLVARVVPVLSRHRSYEATARMLEERLVVEDNLLINALQLSRDSASGTLPVPEAALAEVSAEADRAAGGLEVGRLWHLRPLGRALKYGALAVGAALLYAALFPGYAANALSRYCLPLEDIPPLTVAKIAVEPGDARLVSGETLTVRATVTVRRGALPDGALLAFRSRGEPWQARAMVLASSHPSAHEFAARLGPLRSDLEYRVEAGDARTRRFEVTVVQPPRVVGARLGLTPPAYSGLAAEETPDPAVIRALRDTQAILAFDLDRTPVTAVLDLADGTRLQRSVPASTRRVAFPFPVAHPGRMRLALADASGAARPEAWSAPVTVLEDAAPRVALESEARRQLVPPGTDLPLTATADDDLGLQALQFIVERRSNRAVTVLKRYRYPAPGERRLVERLVVPLDPQAFVPGEEYRFFAEAADFHPSGTHDVRSPAVVVRVATPRELAVEASHPLASPFELLRRLTERQREAVARSVALTELYEEHVAKGRLLARARQLARGQRDVRVAAREVARRFRAAPGGRPYAETLDRLDREEFARIDDALSPARTATSNPVVNLAVEVALPHQRQALAALEALLGRIALAAAQGGADPEVAEGEEPLKPWQEELQKRAAKLKEFLEEQRRLIALTRELEEKSPEDWTEADDQLLGRLEAQELKWAKFFEEAFSDLSKVPDQDFANSHLADEFHEVYMEVKRAADALSAKTVEIAVPLEQAGLELAEELVHNLERWLPDTPDHQKWVMEEPATDFDVPLADLPDELEDIVGDLIDDADAMDESVEDVSSSWMDSLDHGAGWDASGGPISNMSAKGITGNRLPNTDEIGGRSGEGRSGKSHGQFVEKTAEGKGGRETPTRLTEDPFESGSVKDTSNEASGGATGGGKLAGQGVEGLRGRVPPPVMRRLDRLAHNQGELRHKAERLSRTLRKLHLPAGDLEETAKLLGWSENHLRNAVGFDLRTAHANVKSALGRARESLQYEARTLRERGVNLPKRVRDELMGGLRRPVPTGFEEIVRAYYRAIAEGR
ncbi:MAG: hypothetical protein ACYTEZ_02475 [Planctomycetota bacterium]|jgi:hypothetical protein